MENLKPNQIVWLKAVQGNSELQEAKIISVGRIYAVASIGYKQIFFNKDTLEQKHTGWGYGYDYVLYLSKDDYNNKILKRQLVKACKDLNFEKLSIEKLQEIVKIFEDYND